jgi:hypothetical protein
VPESQLKKRKTVDALKAKQAAQKVREENGRRGEGWGGHDAPKRHWAASQGSHSRVIDHVLFYGACSAPSRLLASSSVSPPRPPSSSARRIAIDFASARAHRMHIGFGLDDRRLLLHRACHPPPPTTIVLLFDVFRSLIRRSARPLAARSSSALSRT